MYWDYFETGYIDDLEEDFFQDEPEYIMNTYGAQDPLFDHPPPEPEADYAYDLMLEDAANELAAERAKELSLRKPAQPAERPIIEKEGAA